MRRLLRLSLLVLFWVSLLISSNQGLAQEPHPVSRKLFAARDTNSNGQLLEDEFAGAEPEAERPRARGEFRLLDRDHNNLLSLDEFRNSPRLIPFTERGFMTDPLTKYVVAELKRFDEQYEQWDADGDGELNRSELGQSNFFRVFDRVLSSSRGPDSFLTRTPTGSWIDRSKDDRLSRDEFKFALEVSFGIRRWQGEILRTQSGRVVNWSLFKHVDENRNDSVGRFEYIERAFEADKETAEKNFDAADTDQSLALSFNEWSAIDSKQIEPITEFLKRDANFDGKLTSEELLQGTPEWQRSVAKHLIPGFDLDRNGTLSLEEFRQTPLVDQIYGWHVPLKDQNADGILTREEFVWELDRKIPVLGGLLDLYFNRYDVNGDGELRTDEFAFEVPIAPQASLYRARADGSDVELLVASGTRGFQTLGSPDVSPDGKSVVFEAIPNVGVNMDLSRARLFKLPLGDGLQRELFDLGLGNGPNWSPDGRRLAFFLNPGAQSGEKEGVWIMQADGTNRRHLAPRLRCPKWSPDGKLLLCTTNFLAPHKLVLVDAESGEQAPLLEDHTILGVPEWEPRGQHIVVTTKIGAIRKLQAFKIDELQARPIDLWKSAISPPANEPFFDISRPHWSADGKAVLFVNNDKGPCEFWQVSADGKTAAQPIAASLNDNLLTGVWSPDRQQVIFVSSRKPEAKASGQ